MVIREEVTTWNKSLARSQPYWCGLFSNAIDAGIIQPDLHDDREADAVSIGCYFIRGGNCVVDMVEQSLFQNGPTRNGAGAIQLTLKIRYPCRGRASGVAEIANISLSWISLSG